MALALKREVAGPAYCSTAISVFVGGIILAFWQYSHSVDIAYGSEKSVDKTEKNPLMNVFH